MGAALYRQSALVVNLLDAADHVDNMATMMIVFAASALLAAAILAMWLIKVVLP